MPLEHVIGTWEDFENLVGRLGATAWDEGYFFRGQAHDEWSLVPGIVRLARNYDLSASETQKLERELLTFFHKHAHLYLTTPMLPSQDSAVDCWAVMQHYSAPTRLLDWTALPFAALYFAVDGDDNNPAVVWALNGDALRASLPPLQLPRLPRTPDDWLAPTNSHAAGLFVVSPSTPTDRMAAQHTRFTASLDPLADHGEILGRMLGNPSSLHRIVIPAFLKHVCRQRLRTMNITGATLFPGIDGFGRTLAEIARLSAGFARLRLLYEEWKHRRM